MCMVLALSALLANSNAKASAVTSAVDSTASTFSPAENTALGPRHNRSLMLIPRVFQVIIVIGISYISYISKCGCLQCYAKDIVAFYTHLRTHTTASH